MSQYSTSSTKTLSIASVVLGVISVFFGFTFFVPIIGLVLGVMGRRREPDARTLALIGIWINALLLFGWLIIAVLVIAFGAGLGLLALPFLAFG